MKDAKAVLSKPISVIINQMFSTGIFPDKLKLAKVLPFYKKGKRHYLKTTGLSLFFPQYLNFLKKLF